MESKPKKKQEDPGPELPNDESLTAVSYIDFEDLQDFTTLPSQEELFKTIEFLQCSEDWKQQYECLNHLRVLNRYHPELLIPQLATLSNFVRDQIDNLRSNLSKNSIMLVQEVCAIKRDAKEVAAFLRVVLPIVLIKTTYEKQFIVIEAKKAMQHCFQNAVYSETVDVLAEGCQTKNGTLAEIAIGYLGELLKNVDKEYFLTVTDSTKALMQQLVAEVEGKRMKMKKTAENILQDIKNKIGLENIERVLAETFSSDDRGKEKSQKVMKLFEQKDDKKIDKSKDFRSFLKQQKIQAVKENE